MPNDQHISDRFSGVNNLISNAENWARIDGQLNAHLATYVCVMLSGEIEEAIERMILLRMHSLGDDETANYVTNVVGQRFRNPNWGTINGLLGQFSDQFKSAWTDRFPSQSRVAESLQSINNVKNSFAHTGSNSLHVTLEDVQSYCDDALQAIDHLEQIIVPPHPTI